MHVHRVYVCFILYHCIVVPRPLLEGRVYLHWPVCILCVYSLWRTVIKSGLVLFCIHVGG